MQFLPAGHLLVNMKYIILIFLFCFSKTCFAQQRGTSIIRLSSGDCRKNEVYSFHGPKTITVYKLPEDTLVYTIAPGRYNTWPIDLNNIDTGNYKLAYTNFYNEEIIEKIQVTNQQVNQIFICPDKLLAYPQNTLVKLKNKEVITINFESHGCFHSHYEKLIISKEKNNFIAKLYKVVSNKNENIKVVLLNTVVMNQKNIEDFTRFENELNFAKDGGCTTIDSYSVISKYLNVKKNDGSCNWDGFYFLKQSLFEKRGNK